MLELTHHGDEQRIIQVQLVKITLLKSKIKRTFDSKISNGVDAMAIKNLSDQLSKFSKQLPVSCSLMSLLSSRAISVLRPIKFYLHLFYLSAMQLVHRRILAKFQHNNTSGIHGHVETAVKEGLMAAKMAMRILKLMLQEGTVVKLCWLCT
jgi:hypothetical protein